MLLRVPTNPSDPWSRSLAAQTGHRRRTWRQPPARSTTAASEDPPWSPKNCHPAGIFWAEGWAALTRGPERSASGAEERGLEFGRSLQQRSPAAPERPLSELRRPPPADPDGGGASGLSSPGRFGTVGAEWSGWGKVLQRFRQPRRVRPPSSAPTEGALREEGADGGSNPPRWVEGTAAARHAVMPPPCPEPYRSGESVRGGSAWRPGGSFMAGWRADAPLTGNWDARAWLLVPRGSDARTLRVGGWGGLRREDLRRSCTMSGEDANGGGGRWCAL